MTQLLSDNNTSVAPWVGSGAPTHSQLVSGVTGMDGDDLDSKVVRAGILTTEVDFTIGLLAKIPTLTAANSSTMLAQSDVVATNRQFFFRILARDGSADEGRLQAFAFDGGGNVNRTQSLTKTTYDDDVLHYFLMRCRGATGEVDIFIDGIEEAVYEDHDLDSGTGYAQLGHPGSPSQLVIGNMQSNSAGNWLKGPVGGIDIFDTALSDGAILTQALLRLTTVDIDDGLFIATDKTVEYIARIP